MLEQRDFDLLKNMMESVVSGSEERILNKVDERLADSEERMLNKLDERLADSENLILEEMERTRQILDKRIDKVQGNLDELVQYYRITKLEHDNTALLLKMIDDLSKRIDELERKAERKSA